jgi:hypothetical protein
MDFHKKLSFLKLKLNSSLSLIINSHKIFLTLHKVKKFEFYLSVNIADY